MRGLLLQNVRTTVRNIPALLVLLALVAPSAYSAEPLVDAAWLKANLGTPGVVVLDVHSNRAAYAQGHVPGAVFSHYKKDGWRTTGKKNGHEVAGLLPAVADLERLIGGLGIGNDDHVVIVANGSSPGDMAAATRVYWTFKILGHDAVSILDGGMAAWRADEDNPLEKAAHAPAPKRFTADFQPALIATDAQVRAAMAAGVTLVDARPPDQYLGINKSGSVRAYGTIPGAVNVPGAYTTVNGGGRFRDAAAIGKLYAMTGAPTEGETITFCNTGHWASLGWFVSSEILGNTQTTLYDGSMADWTAGDSAPVERKFRLD